MSYTYKLSDPKNPASQMMVSTHKGWLPDGGDSFRQWMNKPVKRVQVYSWRVAMLLEPCFPSCGNGIRLLRLFRDATCKEWRKTTAAAIKIARRAGKVRLPVYDEQKGEYTLTNGNTIQARQLLGEL